MQYGQQGNRVPSVDKVLDSLEESSGGVKVPEACSDRGSLVPTVEGKSRRQVVEQDPPKRNKDAAASVYKKMSRLGRVLRTKKKETKTLDNVNKEKPPDRSRQSGSRTVADRSRQVAEVPTKPIPHRVSHCATQVRRDKAEHVNESIVGSNFASINAENQSRWLDLGDRRARQWWNSNLVVSLRVVHQDSTGQRASCTGQVTAKKPRLYSSMC
jgi:hypothetical protein